MKRLAIGLVAVVASIAVAPAHAAGPGSLLDSATATANVTATSGGALVVQGNSITLDGSTSVLVSFTAPAVNVSSTGGVIFRLFDGATQIGRIADTRGGSTSGVGNVYSAAGTVLLTPSSGSHTYSVKAALAGSGTQTVSAGDGVGDHYVPALLTVEQVSGSYPDDDSAYCTGLSGPCADTDSGGGGGGCSTLSCLSDVQITSPAQGQELDYDPTSSTWKNADTCGTTDAGMPACRVDIATSGVAGGFLNNVHDDLFVIVGAILGAALIPLIVRWFTGGRD